MKKIIVLFLVLYSIINFFEYRCESWSYDKAVFHKSGVSCLLQDGDDVDIRPILWIYRIP